MTDAAIKRTRLFSMLLCEEFQRCRLEHWTHAFVYKNFLRREVKRHPCYAAALKQIGAA